MQLLQGFQNPEPHLSVSTLTFRQSMLFFIIQIDALAEVIAVTQGTNVEVYLDGGVRLGTDVLKALALGARAVFIGRPVWWGLTYKVRNTMSASPLLIMLSSYSQLRFINNQVCVCFHVMLYT